jgi:hypothetical protein
VDRASGPNPVLVGHRLAERDCDPPECVTVCRREDGWIVGGSGGTGFHVGISPVKRATGVARQDATERGESDDVERRLKNLPLNEEGRPLPLHQFDPVVLGTANFGIIGCDRDTCHSRKHPRGLRLFRTCC